jgi:hypothetical protein
MPKIQSTPVAVSVPFDNSTNGFTSTNVQTAIEEARVASSGFDENKILTSAVFEVLVDSNGNVLRGS